MFGEWVEMNVLFIENDLDRFKKTHPVKLGGYFWMAQMVLGQVGEK
jgi:hypothetical protein